jgi:hypothetical protein
MLGALCEKMRVFFGGWPRGNVAEVWVRVGANWVLVWRRP